MKAVFYSKNGSVDVLQYGDQPDPVCKNDHIIIRVKYVSLEGGDFLNRRVTPPPFTPFIGGYQAAGYVETIGADVTEFKIGDAVVGFNWFGSHAELFACPANTAFAVPHGLDLALASTIPVPFGTAHDSLFEFGGLQSGETVLIQGATGGVGIAAVQLAQQAGAIVIGTGSSPDQLRKLQDLGMHYAVNYKTDKIDKSVLDITNGKGVDLIVDMAGGQSVDTLMKSVRYRGRYAIVGASDDLPHFKFFDVIRKSLALYGISFGQEMHLPRARAMLAEIFESAKNGDFIMPIDKIFPLQQAANAHLYAQTQHPFGRVLLEV